MDAGALYFLASKDQRFLPGLFFDLRVESGPLDGRGGAS